MTLDKSYCPYQIQRVTIDPERKLNPPSPWRYAFKLINVESKQVLDVAFSNLSFTPGPLLAKCNRYMDAWKRAMNGNRS